MAELLLTGKEVHCVEQESTWLYETLPATVTVSGSTVTASDEVNFFNAVTGELLGHGLSIEVSGPLFVRAGQETQSRLNEVFVRG